MAAQTTPRTKEEQIVYQSSLKAVIEYLKLREKNNVNVNMLFNMTYLFSEYCLNNTKGDNHFKTMISKIDELLNEK